MQLLFGFTSEIPTNITQKTMRDIKPVYNYDDYYYELRYKLGKAFVFARKSLRKAKETAKERRDKRSKSVKFEVGQRVMLKNPIRNGKMSPHWKGPYDIVGLNGDLNVTLKIGNRKGKYHVNRLKIFGKKKMT